MPEIVTRIPAEKIDQYNDWSLPSVNSKNIVSAIKEEKNNIRRRVLEQKEKARQLAKAEKEKTGNPEKSHPSTEKGQSPKEQILDEEIDESALHHGMSPEQLQKITEDAEKTGYAEGYEKGFTKAKEDGYQQGLDKAEKESEEKLAQQKAALVNITQQLTTFFNNEKDTIESQMVDMICQLTSSVVQRELMIDSSTVVKVVQDSLSLLADQTKHLTVFVHSQDITIVREAFDDTDYDMRIDVDDTLLPGGCRIDNGRTTIDASINKQLDSVIEQFLTQSYSHSVDGPISEAIASDDSNANDNKASDNVEENTPHKEPPVMPDPEQKTVDQNQQGTNEHDRQENNTEGQQNVPE